ncbi:cytosine permease [Streptomyces sp. Lzd4kr]|nr:cytosine permease [Streptomyces sp. Lzd4kr]
MSAQASKPPTLAMEERSIEHVPAAERHGKVWHQGPFWFTGNFVLLTMFVGFTGPSLGLSAGWSILAIVIGIAVGTFFMAFHANQGPHMGLPQMIQSRAQFGSRGAIIPFIATTFVYVGFNVFCVLTVAEGIHMLVGGPLLLWNLLLVIASIALAVYGYNLLQVVQRWLTYLLIVVFLLVTIAILAHGDTSSASAGVSGSGWNGTAFLVQLGLSAGYNISYSVYVSDHSRYLPERAAGGRLIGWIYGGAALSAVWLMSVGALLGSWMPDLGPLDGLKWAGDVLVPGFGVVVLITALVAQTTIISVNLYGASLTTITCLDAFRPVRPTLRLRVNFLLGLGVLIFVTAAALPHDLLANYNAFVTLLLYALVPWTAINLVDYYLIRRGRYVIDDIIDSDGGIYGRWSPRALTAYGVSFAAMIPFFSLSFYVGPIAELLGGADIAFVVGLAVSAGLYAYLARDVDADAEVATRETSLASTALG